MKGAFRGENSAELWSQNLRILLSSLYLNNQLAAAGEEEIFPLLNELSRLEQLLCIKSLDKSIGPNDPYRVFHPLQILSSADKIVLLADP